MPNIASHEIDRALLAEIAAESLARVAQAKNSKRWTNAIAKAVVEIENNPYMTYDVDSHSLLILSQESGEIYTANGTCQCRAYELNQPCWHRAASRLVVRYLEKLN